MTLAEQFRNVKAGDRITIRTPRNQERTGRVVMRAGSPNERWVKRDGKLAPEPAYVLNMGGAHGTPGIATLDNVVRVSKARK